jgi:hypothetical protein
VADCFPRTPDLPPQSPLFWVTHKDRYLRQQLIRDLEADTGRALIVYFANSNDPAAQIDGNDDQYVAEVLNAVAGKPVDLLLETNGGATDATEKICSLLRSGAPDLRVVVPRRAKSNGTVIALSGQKILMGLESELGPIDPSINNVPVEFVLNAPAGTVGPIDMQIAETARKQTQKLAKELLSTGMLKGKSPEELKIVIDRISTREHYHSHGSVIDAKEAESLGFAVEWHDAASNLWRKFTLLRAMYAFDSAQQGFSKIFEGNRISLVVTARAGNPA